MNALERAVDRRFPVSSVSLRLLKYRLQRDPNLRVMTYLVGPGECAVDVGANRGVYTLWLCHMVGPTGRVHSVEPYPRNVDVLRSLEARRKNLTVHGLAVSDRPGQAQLYVPVFGGRPVDALASLIPPSVEHRSVSTSVSTLDELLPSDQVVTFIKCDVEGKELAVLRGASRTLAQGMPSLLVEIEQRHQSIDIRVVFDHLCGLGYGGYFLDSRRLRPLADFDVQSHQLAFLTPQFRPHSMPSGYVYDFLFVRPGLDLSGLRSALAV